MKNNKTAIRTLVVLAIVLVVFSVVAFVLPFTKNGVFWLAYVMGVIAIAAQAYMLYTAFAKGESVKSKFYGYPVARIGVVYLAAQLVLSLIAMIAAPYLPVWIPVIVFVVMLGAAAIGFIATDAIRDEVERQDGKIKADVSYMRDLQSRVGALNAQLTDEELIAAVRELADALRYSDPVSKPELQEIEAELFSCVDELQRTALDGDKPAALALCKKATGVLAERNRLCKLSK